MNIILFRTFKKCGGILYSVVLVFFPAKSRPTNNHWNDSSDISYSSPFSCDSNDIKTFGKKCSVPRKLK